METAPSHPVQGMRCGDWALESPVVDPAEELLRRLALNDEKVLGTAHVAFGDNRGSYGGDNEASIHVDGVMADASIWADDTLVVERGRLV